MTTGPSQSRTVSPPGDCDLLLRVLLGLHSFLTQNCWVCRLSLSTWYNTQYEVRLCVCIHFLLYLLSVTKLKRGRKKNVPSSPPCPLSPFYLLLFSPCFSHFFCVSLEFFVFRSSFLSYPVRPQRKAKFAFLTVLATVLISLS